MHIPAANRFLRIILFSPDPPAGLGIILGPDPTGFTILPQSVHTYRRRHQQEDDRPQNTYKEKTFSTDTHAFPPFLKVPPKTSHF
jgi:hypothetical protein